MRFLFVHQNFPGQFRHISAALAALPQHEVVGMGEGRRVKAQSAAQPLGVRVLGYETKAQAGEATHPYLRSTESHVRRGQSVFRAAMHARENGFMPDVVVAHPGWGEAIFLRDVFAQARHIYYSEYFYQRQGGDVGFDPAFASTLDGLLQLRTRNCTQLMSMVEADALWSPTEWQKSRYPQAFQNKIRVIHDGIRSDIVQPDAQAVLEVAGKRFVAGQPIVTYVARNLEPYRGFHTFMRALPLILKKNSSVQVLVVGGDGVSYGTGLPPGQSYRELYCAELGAGVDWSRVHFLGQLPYSDYVRALQVSALHVYYTYPFVLSWSMLEAMSAGCLVLGSATAPVQEVIEHGKNGLLSDFFDAQALAETALHVLRKPADYAALRQAARRTVLDRYDLHTQCLPQQIAWLTGTN